MLVGQHPPHNKQGSSSEEVGGGLNRKLYANSVAKVQRGAIRRANILIKKESSGVQTIVGGESLDKGGKKRRGPGKKKSQA